MRSQLSVRFARLIFLRFQGGVGGVSNLRVVHRKQLLRLLAVAQAGLPQLSLQLQLDHYAPDVFVSLSHVGDLLRLLPVQGLKLSVEARLDVVNHILRSDEDEIGW